MSLLETKLLRAFLLLSWVINVAFLYQWLHGRAYATISTEVVAVLNQTLASMLPAILAQHMKSPPCAAQGQIGDKAHNPSDELLLGKVLKAVEGLDSRMHGATSNVATDAPKVLETRPPSISAGGSTEVPREIAESERRMKELELEEKNMVGGCKDDLQGLLAATRGAMEDCQDNKDKCPSAVLVRRFCPVTCKKCVPTETAAPKKARVIVDAAVGKVFSTSKPLPSKNVFVPPAGEWKMLGKDELSTHLEKFEVQSLETGKCENLPSETHRMCCLDGRCRNAQMSPNRAARDPLAYRHSSSDAKAIEAAIIRILDKMPGCDVLVAGDSIMAMMWSAAVCGLLRLGWQPLKSERELHVLKRPDNAGVKPQCAEVSMHYYEFGRWPKKGGGEAEEIFLREHFDKHHTILVNFGAHYSSPEEYMQPLQTAFNAFVRLVAFPEQTRRFVVWIDTPAIHWTSEDGDWSPQYLRECEATKKKPCDPQVFLCQPISNPSKGRWRQDHVLKIRDSVKHAARLVPIVDYVEASKPLWRNHGVMYRAHWDVATKCTVCNSSVIEQAHDCLHPCYTPLYYQPVWDALKSVVMTYL